MNLRARRMALGLLGALAVAALAALLVLSVLYMRDMDRAYGRLEGRSTVVDTAHGRVELTDRGTGAPVLVVHGSGGGFDQGELIAEAVLDPSLRRITPSRYGYLRSEAPAGASFDDQAQAYAELLDRLGIDRVAVVAMSHGGPSALLFAALYPQRVASLTLISCGVAATASPDQAQADRQGRMLVTVFSHDLLYWGLSRLLRPQLLRLMGADEGVIAGLTASQRALVDRLVESMNPVAPRAAGAAFDNRAAMPNERIAAIRAPTLILHARDDTLQVFANAEFAARTIPGARLRAFDRGGHLLIAVEQPAVRAEVDAFIRAHPP